MKTLARFLLLLSLGWTMPSMADTSVPLLYTRSTIVITRYHLPPPMPWQGKNAPQENPRIPFDVEVRDAMTLYSQKGWYNLDSPSVKSGVLMMFRAPGISPIMRMTQYAPLDILFIDREGKITQIIPNINLSALDQEIMPENTVLAFLFLRGGTCKALSVNPGDIVDYKLFKKPPVILSVPVTSDQKPAADAASSNAPALPVQSSPLPPPPESSPQILLDK